MAFNINNVVDNVIPNKSYQQQQPMTLNEFQNLMSTPRINGQIVSNYNEVLQYNVGFDNSIHIFINPFQRQIYMKYLDTQTGNDKIHIFNSIEASPIDAFSKTYQDSNQTQISTQINSNDIDNMLNNTQQLYSEHLDEINEKLDKVLKLEPDIKKIINELGVNGDAKQSK